MKGFVHIVDDDASFRTAMERRLKQAGYEVATYPSALHLLVNLPAESIPSCILLDVRIPGLDGPGLQKRLGELGSTLPIIFLTGYPDIPATVRAIKAGADDFLTKPVSSDDLFRAIERAFAHHQTLRDLKDKLDSVRARLGRLTPREREVFDLVIRGNTNKQVARELGCTERTIKAHRHRVMKKMQVLLAGTCIPCRAGRRCVGYPTDNLGCLSTSLALLLFDGTIENLLYVAYELRMVFDPLAARFVSAGQVRDVSHAKSEPRYSG